MAEAEERPPASSGDAVADTSAALLPMLTRALDAYRTLAEVPMPADPKLATAQQQACKASLMHLEALMKLVRLAGQPGGGAADDADGSREAAAVVARARQAFDTYNKGEPG